MPARFSFEEARGPVHAHTHKKSNYIICFYIHKLTFIISAIHLKCWMYIWQLNSSVMQKAVRNLTYIPLPPLEDKVEKEKKPRVP